MVRRTALLGLSLLLSVTAVAGCADTPGKSTAGQDTSPSGNPDGTFDTRAEQVARAWRTAGNTDLWRSGFVPLQDLTVPPDGAPFNDATKQAFTAGWYRLETAMPRERGGATGTIHYPDGSTSSVPLVTRADAYGALDQGDPPACPGATIPPVRNAPAAGRDARETGTGGGTAANPGAALPATGRPVLPGNGADLPITGGAAPKSCAALTVTGVTLGTVDLLTSRGRAQVPAWLFKVRELGGTVARVAVAPSAVSKAPEVRTGKLPTVTGLVGAHNLVSVDGAKLSYRLALSACDKDVRALFYEADDVVVVGGTAVRSSKVCTEQLVLRPVQVVLDATPGTRPVLDAVSGRVLTVQPTVFG